MKDLDSRKRVLRIALWGLLIAMASMTNVYADSKPAVTIGKLNYWVNDDDLTATVTGHMNGTSATGSITIPSHITYNSKTYTVTSIDSSAFFHCSRLTGSLTIPNSVTEIGDRAFGGCSGFTGSLTIPNSVSSIGNGAFGGCSGFTGSLTIPNSVSSIGNGAFQECSGFTGSLTIPNSVSSIGNGAFQGCSGFTGSLTIPNSVSSIGNGAFQGCSGFTGDLIIPNSVTSIGDLAFFGCSGFTGDLTIGNSVTTIGENAFQECSGFTGDLTIGNSVTEIGDYAFYGCSGFTEVYFYAANYREVVQVGGQFVGCGGSLSFGNNVKHIPSIFGSGFTGSLTIPSSVTEIEIFAFNGCNFSEVFFNATNCNVYYEDVWYDNWLPFYGCSGTLVLGENVEHIPSCMFKHGAFTGNLTIPNSVKTIGDQAFEGCRCFTGDLTIGNSVTTIGDYAFKECTGFNSSVTIPSSITSIGLDAFFECFGFTSVYYTGDIIQWCDISFSGYYANPLTSAHNLYIDNTLVTNLVIPDGVTEIKNCTFLGGKCFTNSLCIPNSVTSIGGGAFLGCSGFTGDLIIPNSVTSIGGEAFAGCSGFTGNLTIPNSVTSIGGGAFSGCSGFTGDLIIPNSVTSIGRNAFRGCSGFTGDLTIGNSVTTIGDCAFCECSGFTANLTIGNSMTTIGDGAFVLCSFGSITVFAEEPPLLEDYLGDYLVFNGINHDIPVVVPCGSLELYLNSLGWSYFSNIKDMCPREITANPNPTEGGMVDGPGIYEYGETATLTATPNEGYVFMNWTEDNEQVSLDSVYSFVVKEDRNLVANFTTDTNYYAVLATVNPSDGGKVLGEGLYLQGQTAALIAVPNEGFAFINWTEYGIPVSTNPSFSFTVTEDVFLEANFGPGCTLTFDLNDTYYDGWTGNYLVVTDGNGNSQYLTIEYGSTASYSITFLNGDHISLSWIEGYGIGTDECSFKVSYENGTGIYAGANLSSGFSYGFDVNCDAPPIYYTVTATAVPTNGGTVSGAGTYECTEICTLEASASDGYSFLYWMLATGEIISTNSTFSFSVNEDIELAAIFGPVCNITFNLYDSYGDSWNGNYLVVTDENGFSKPLTIQYYESTVCYVLPFLVGTHLTLTWIEGNWINECSFTMSYEDGTMIYEGANLSGNFSYEFNVDCESAPPIYYTISATSNPINGGAVSGGGAFIVGETCTLTASANDGYIFANWTKNGEVVSNSETYSFTVTENAAFVANFEINTVTRAIALSEGWNWVSFNVDITLADLKAALVAALGNTTIQIKSKDKSTTYNGDSWRGSLNSLDVYQMYKIKTSDDCTITLTGIRIMPESYPVIINHGVNWIGFPLNESISISDAFDGFAVNGDLIKSKDRSSSYNGSTWRGTLNTLEFGKGYIYKSIADEQKVFYFPH